MSRLSYPIMFISLSLLGGVAVAPAALAEGKKGTFVGGETSSMPIAAEVLGGKDGPAEENNAETEAPGTFTAGETPESHTHTELVGQLYGTAQENYFELFEEHITCSAASFVSTDTDGTATDLSLEPIYAGCTWASFPATVTTNGCVYTLAPPTPIAGGKYTSETDLVCPGSNGIEWHVYTASNHAFSLCTLTIPTDTSITGHTLYTGVESEGKDHLTLRMEAEGITAEKEGLCGAGHSNEGVFAVNMTLRAYKAGDTTKKHDLWIS